MPARKIPKNYVCITGIVSASKAIGEAAFEGPLERDLYKLLEFDPEVANFEVQPVIIHWLDSRAKKHRYTPDCRIHYRGDLHRKSLLVETKLRAYLREKWKAIRPALRAGVHQANHEGSHFKILTEREIRTQYLKSVRFLLPAVRQGAGESAQRLLLQALSELGETTPRGLLNHVSNDHEEQAYLTRTIWYLIGTFQIYADLSAPLSMQIAIKLP
jgi:hypothetical protein